MSLMYSSTFVRQIRFFHLLDNSQFSFQRKSFIQWAHRPIQLIQGLTRAQSQFSTMSSNSSSSYSYMYLHGFASGSKSTKGILLKKFLAEQQQGNIELRLPDLNTPSFEKLSFTVIVQQLKNEILNSEKQFRLIGSSLGGLIAVILASELKESSKIQSLLLLCPALDAADRWKGRMTDSELHQWKLSGIKFFYNYQTHSEQPLHYGFYEDLLQQVQYPVVDVPITIIHGLNDDVVPISVSRKYVEMLSENGLDNELIEANDDHHLIRDESIEVIKNVIRSKWLDAN